MINTNGTTYPICGQLYTTISFAGIFAPTSDCNRGLNCHETRRRTANLIEKVLVANGADVIEFQQGTADIYSVELRPALIERSKEVLDRGLTGLIEDEDVSIDEVTWQLLVHQLPSAISLGLVSPDTGIPVYLSAKELVSQRPSPAQVGEQGAIMLASNELKGAVYAFNRFPNELFDVDAFSQLFPWMTVARYSKGDILTVSFKAFVQPADSEQMEYHEVTMTRGIDVEINIATRDECGSPTTSQRDIRKRQILAFHGNRISQRHLSAERSETVHRRFVRSYIERGPESAFKEIEGITG